MNWAYITGFFDADGSITLSCHKNSKHKTVQLSFHNNELIILEDIKRFIEKELNIKGSISTKKPNKDAHNIAYDLKYVYFNKVNKILKHMDSKHPKKVHRIMLSFELELLTPRNGKYSEDMLKLRFQKEKEFFAH